MKLLAEPAWRLEDGASNARRLDARVLALLRAVAERKTLVAAARAAGVPYRTAWALLEETGRLLGVPVVDLKRGQGATLTPIAKRWIAADDETRRLLAARVRPVEPAPAQRAGHEALRPLKLAASHDIALAQLRDRWRAAHDVVIEFHASAESLDALHAGRVDVAGFHVATGSTRKSDPLLARVDPDKDVLWRFLTREQGLIVPRGNPKHVRALADIAAKRLAIVNRQPGSGTRLLLDRMLADEGIEPAQLAGYSNEEFTHAAVAATVASGKADAGFGIKAAAAQFGLGFVPLATERYLFACRARRADTPRLRAFRALLSSAATRAVVAPLAGYALDVPGTMLSLGPVARIRR